MTKTRGKPYEIALATKQGIFFADVGRGDIGRKRLDEARLELHDSLLSQNRVTVFQQDQSKPQLSEIQEVMGRRNGVNIFNSKDSGSEGHNSALKSDKGGKKDTRGIDKSPTDNASLKSGGLGPINERESARRSSISKGPAAMVRTSQRQSNSSSQGFKGSSKRQPSSGKK